MDLAHYQDISRCAILVYSFAYSNHEAPEICSLIESTVMSQSEHNDMNLKDIT